MLCCTALQCTVRTYGGFEGRSVDVSRDGDDDLHVVGDGARLELRLGLYHVFYAAVAVRFHHRLHPYQGFH